MWEAVLLSITPAYARLRMEDGTVVGQKLEEFKSNIDRPLAAILTLNTIAHTVGAIGVGAEATRIWGGNGNELITGVAVPVGMTAAVLILSEIIPKTIGANYWKKLAPFTIASLSFIVTLLAPLVWVCQLVTRSMRMEELKSVFSRNDFINLAKIGAEEGVFEEEESELIKNLIKFEQITAEDIMTPRVVVQAAPETMTVKEFYKKHPDLEFSRIPVYQDGQKDLVTGYVLKDKILSELVHERSDTELGDIAREITVIHESKSVPDLFRQLIEDHEHIALVVDEFGTMAGIVTMEDMIETLLGTEILDEVDNIEDMQDLARQKWRDRVRKLGLVQAQAEGEDGDDNGQESDDTPANSG
jgi:CBS domain containing-hemolysin-like protein